MAGNPLVDQGSLNKVKGSVSYPNHPELNVTSIYLAPDMIRMGVEGNMTTMLPTATGTVTSPEPYLMGTVTLSLLRTQSFSDLYKQQWEADSRVGNLTVRPDLDSGVGISAFDFNNCAIESVREMPMNGTDATMVVTLRGFYVINNNLWN